MAGQTSLVVNRIPLSMKTFTPDPALFYNNMHDSLKGKLFKKHCLILVRVASSDVGIRPKPGGLGNLVEKKGKFRDYSLYCTIIHFGSFPAATACRHPKGAIFVHILIPYFCSMLPLYIPVAL